MASVGFRLLTKESFFKTALKHRRMPRLLGASASLYIRRSITNRGPKGGVDDEVKKALHPLPLIKYDIKEQLEAELPVVRKKHGRFISPWPKTYKKMSDMFHLAVSNFNAKWNELPQEMNTLPAVAVDKELMKSIDHAHITWIGHSTCYVQLNGKFFLTDPIWSARASMFQWIGPKRFRPPPIDLDDLHIDFVLLSHDHYDHFDVSTAKRIGNRAKWIVPKGLKKTLRGLGVTNVVELSWWESFHVPPGGDATTTTTTTSNNNKRHSSSSDQSPSSTAMPTSTARPGGVSDMQPHNLASDGSIEIVFTPTQHWSCRGLFDRCTVLWGSFCVLSREKKFFFAGDTAYCSVFKQIGQIYGPFDLTILPIGAYKPRWFLRDYHVDPSEAMQLHRDLDSKQSVAVHWGTFKLSEERCVEPALELGRVRDIAGEPASTFATMAHGETVKFGESPRFDYVSLYPQFLQEHIEKDDY